ncbi:MAG TPA: chromosome segregation protein SMC [Candidatus Acidoferrales bacterium]|nr:chromosome segregation protein SMC [Candidatus Acidoferrales bacterium]
MRLRRLVISGFKTFASRAEVTLDRGITAIVGPNGSGKSNLVDALRWALGETNARELRGQRMDEVVYAGGGKRPRLNVAEVELVIDNEEGRLPVADPEVAVSRRVVRGASDTEYRLNGERVRLRDLERLLGATGLTQNGYAVVAQNDIDGIIEATPTQRRALVEQAAGVRSMRVACEDAVARIGHAEVTLRRIEDLLADGEPRLVELADQSTTALAQRELTDRLIELRGSLAREEWRAARGRLKLARRRLDHATSRWEAADEADAGFSTRAAAERGRLERVRGDRDSARQDLEAARLAAERAAADARQWNERLRAAVLRRSVGREEARAAQEDAIAAAAASGRNRDAQRGEGSSALAALRAHCADLQRVEADARLALAADEAGLADAEADLTTAVAAERDAEAAVRQARLQLQLIQNSTASLDADVAAAVSALDRLSADLAGAADAAAAADRAAAEAEAQLASAQAAAEAAWEDVNAAEEVSAEASEAARTALARAAEARGRLSGAMGGDGGVGQAVARGVVSARRLIDCVSVRNPADAIAVAAALEGHATAWLVADTTGAAAFFDARGPREELVDAGDPADDHDPAPPAPFRRAVDAVEVLSAARPAVVDVLRGVWLVDDMSGARGALAAGARIAVLPDGRAVETRRIRGGNPGHTLEYAAEDRAAERDAADATIREAAAIAAVAAARERVSAAEGAAVAAVASAQAARGAAATAAATLTARGEQVDAAERRLEQNHAARGERHGQEEAAQRASGDAAARSAEARNRVEDARSRADHAAAGLHQRRDALASAATAAREVELELARGEGALTEAADRAADLSRALAVAEARRDAARARIAAAEVEALAALAEGGAARRAAAGAVAAVTAARARADDTAPLLEELERVLVALETERSEVAVSLARAEDERAAAQIELDQAELDLQRLTDVARDEGDDDGADWDPEAADRAEREIVRLERRISALGPVNGLAPEQYEALLARVTVLREHHADLSAACTDIRSVARRLAADLERRFDSVFDAVSLEFQKLFAELFPGGRATLRLEEPPIADADEEEEAEGVADRRPGVEILAQPPGKRLGALRLLSGGERALTALAVVLALQQVNPSPFYVFDEVDAALDDSNVLRFTRLLRRLAADQQFIMVTHNHITMAAADVLWGITIDSDGVSSVIGVQFDADVRPEHDTVPGLQRVPMRAVR